MSFHVLCWNICCKSWFSLIINLFDFLSPESFVVPWVFGWDYLTIHANLLGGITYTCTDCEKERISVKRNIIQPGYYWLIRRCLYSSNTSSSRRQQLMQEYRWEVSLPSLYLGFCNVCPMFKLQSINVEVYFMGWILLCVYKRIFNTTFNSMNKVL